MTYPDASLPWPIPYAAVKLVAEKEGCKLQAYLCEAGKPTLAWGETHGISLGMTCTQSKADQMLCDRLIEFTDQVLGMCTRTPTPTQLGAMTCLAYNIGLAGFHGSSVLRLHDAGAFPEAAKAFLMWDKLHDAETGELRESAGLLARRKAEAALYLS